MSEQIITKNPSGDLCQHGAYADLCITCDAVAIAKELEADTAYARSHAPDGDRYAPNGARLWDTGRYARTPDGRRACYCGAALGTCGHPMRRMG